MSTLTSLAHITISVVLMTVVKLVIVNWGLIFDRVGVLNMRPPWVLDLIPRGRRFE